MRFFGVLVSLLLASCGTAHAQSGQCAQFSMGVKNHPVGETTYTLAVTDQCALLNFANTGAEVVNMPNPGSHFPFGWVVWLFAQGSGGLTLTPTSPVTVNGTTTLPVAQNAGAYCATDGRNWVCKP